MLPWHLWRNHACFTHFEPKSPSNDMGHTLLRFADEHPLQTATWKPLRSHTKQPTFAMTPPRVTILRSLKLTFFRIHGAAGAHCGIRIHITAAAVGRSRQRPHCNTAKSSKIISSQTRQTAPAPSAHACISARANPTQLEYCIADLQVCHQPIHRRRLTCYKSTRSEQVVDDRG